MGEIVLRSGWDVFATANNLEENDYLMFQLCGNSSFKVQIYNSCCGSQKITSFVNPSSDISGLVPPSTCDHHVPNGNEAPYPGHVRRPTEFAYFTSGGSYLTRAQDEKVLEMARTIKSDTPLYTTIMKKSNVNAKGCFINIPCIPLKGFREGLVKATVQLEAPDSNIYSVSAAQHGDDEIVLQSGWDHFVVAHCVQENDILIFRYKGSNRLEVFILDPNGCLKTSCFGKKDVSNAQELSDDSVEFLDPPLDPAVVVDLSSSSDDDTIVPAQTAKSTRPRKQQLGRCAKITRMASTSTPSGHETDELGDVEAADIPSYPPCIISRVVVLSRAQEKMILQKVQALGSEFPIFVMVMHKSSIGEKGAYVMNFTKEYARICLPSATQDVTLHMEWCTRLYVGHSRYGSHKVITRGWQNLSPTIVLLWGISASSSC